jgi:UDP-glucose 4-epimerase
MTSSDRTLLVTGAAGFVMSVLAREWLERDSRARVVILDRSPLDAAAQKWFAPVMDRVQPIVTDILDAERWAPQLDDLGISSVVHGATITPISRGSALEASREPEAEDPARIVEVNLMGTVKILEWARRARGLKRLLYVSSGSVYRNHGPDWAPEPLPEDGYVGPLKLYGVSKFASEMIVNRYADLFRLSAASVRLASVYGPMDRATESRNFRHVPHRVAHMALSGEVIRPTNLEAVGDYIHAADVARAILALLDAPSLRYRAYNIATGETVSIGQFIDWAREKAPALRCEVTPFESCNIDQDPRLSTGMWGAYDISRIVAETGWRPRPVREAFLSYIDWIAANELVS